MMLMACTSALELAHTYLDPQGRASGAYRVLPTAWGGPKALAAGLPGALPGEEEVRNMPGLMKREPRGEAADIPGRFDRLLDEWTRMIPFRPVPFPHWWGVEDLIRVEEFREDGVLVIRADLPGIDPEADVELTVSHGVL